MLALSVNSLKHKVSLARRITPNKKINLTCYSRLAKRYDHEHPHKILNFGHAY